MVIIEMENKILFVEAEEADSFYGYLKVGETLAYIEDNKVWLKHYSRRVKELESTKEEMDALGLIFINEMNFVILNEAKEYIANKFESYIENENFQKQVSSDLADIRADFNQSNMSLLEKLDNEYMFSGNTIECTFDEKLKNSVEKRIKQLISEIAVNVLNKKELSKNENSIIELFIDNKDKFWDLISSKLEEKLIKRYSYKYALIKRDIEDFEDAKKIIPIHNIVKEYNSFIYDLKKEIESIVKDKCKTMIIESGNYSFKTYSTIYVSESILRNNSETIIIDGLTVKEDRCTAYIVDPRDIKPFKIISRKKVIYELSERNINKLKEYVNQFKNIGFEI